MRVSVILVRMAGSVLTIASITLITATVPRNTPAYTASSVSSTTMLCLRKQESCAVAEMTARCAQVAA